MKENKRKEGNSIKVASRETKMLKRKLSLSKIRIPIWFMNN